MRVLSNFKAVISSPVTYIGAGYSAAFCMLLAQDAVIRGGLVPGSITSNALASTLIPLTAVGPAIGAGLGIRYLKHGVRSAESLIGIVGAAPLLLVWLMAILRFCKYHW